MDILDSNLKPAPSTDRSEITAMIDIPGINLANNIIVHRVDIGMVLHDILMCLYHFSDSLAVKGDFKFTFNLDDCRVRNRLSGKNTISDFVTDEAQFGIWCIMRNSSVHQGDGDPSSPDGSSSKTA
jgi:hypothetical protein